MNEEIKNNELKDEDLEQVAGGGTPTTGGMWKLDHVKGKKLAAAVKYSISAIPMGGFVAVQGTEIESGEKDEAEIQRR